MLSDVEIKSFIESGKITIVPHDEIRLEASNYSLTLGTKILIPKSDQIIDLKDTSAKVEYDEFEMNDNDGYVLKPKEFILGQTAEKIGMDEDIGMILDGRSTLARMGISVHQTSQFIQPGQDIHIITLEIFNAGNMTIKFYPGIKIAKLLFFQTKVRNSRGYRSYGKYAGQDVTTGARLVKM